VRKVMWGFWWLCLAFAAGCVAWVGWGVISFMTSDDPFNTVNEAGCAEAMAFVGAPMPENTSDEHCTSYSWLDQEYRGSFRMPRGAAKDWLAESFPEAESSPCAQDLCAMVQKHPHDAETTGAYEVSVSVRYEGGSTGHTALVTFDAYAY